MRWRLRVRDRGFCDRAVAVALPSALVVYAGVAGLAEGRWLSTAAALLAATLLVRAHPRARFAAYVFLSVLALRALLRGHWPTAGFAAAVLAVLQTPAAVRRWPRLPRPGRSQAGHGGRAGTASSTPES